MKKIFTLIATIVLTVSVFAQAPQKIKYQVVVRDSSNNLLTSISVGMQINILQGSATGASVYVETQTPSTNANGLASIKIGNGIVVSGDFTTIDWTNGPYYIQTETDPAGGTSYSITSTSRLISVPYAIHAKPIISKKVWNYNWKIVSTRKAAPTNINVDTAGTGIGVSDNIISATDSSSHYVGELYGGGIVFWVELDKQHGLIASLDDLDGGSGVQWGLFETDVSNCESMTDGAANTKSIIAAGGSAYEAAGLCDSYSDGGFTDWYLPSNRELFILSSQNMLIDSILNNDEDSETNGLTQDNVSPTFGRYWSSTEPNNYSAWPYYFASGYSTYFNKFNTYRVRAVRAF